MDKLIKEALEIRRLIIINGGMATKSTVEDVLIMRHPNLSRYDAHGIMNHIESTNRDMRINRRDNDTPSLDDYPELLTVQPQPKFVDWLGRP